MVEGVAIHNSFHALGWEIYNPKVHSSSVNRIRIIKADLQPLNVSVLVFQFRVIAKPSGWDLGHARRQISSTLTGRVSLQSESYLDDNERCSNRSSSSPTETRDLHSVDNRLEILGHRGGVTSCSRLKDDGDRRIGSFEMRVGGNTGPA